MKKTNFMLGRIRKGIKNKIGIIVMPLYKPMVWLLSRIMLPPSKKDTVHREKVQRRQQSDWMIFSARMSWRSWGFFSSKNNYMTELYKMMNGEKKVNSKNLLSLSHGAITWSHMPIDGGQITCFLLVALLFYATHCNNMWQWPGPMSVRTARSFDVGLMLEWVSNFSCCLLANLYKEAGWGLITTVDFSLELYLP